MVRLATYRISSNHRIIFRMADECIYSQSDIIACLQIKTCFNIVSWLYIDASKICVANDLEGAVRHWLLKNDSSLVQVFKYSTNI